MNPRWASEVEPYPIAVTRSRFPNMKHLGDISKINGAEIEPVDVITFGSPCQDLSVAGKQAGMKHQSNGDSETTRSGLFMEAVRIIKEMRRATNGNYPKFAVWENVPGAFSSNKGEDFRIVLEEMVKISDPKAPPVPAPETGKWPYADCIMGNGWSVAYRTLDAQYWGVPQRRRRIYLVADFRGERAGQVLFKREGLRGYFTEGGTPWQGTASNVKKSTGANDQEGEVVHERQLDAVALSSVASTLRAGAGAPKHEQDFVGRLVLEPTCYDIGEARLRTPNEYKDLAPTITARCGTGGNNTPAVVYPTNQYLFENHSQDTRYKGPLDVAPIVSANFGMGGNNQPFVIEPEPVYCLQGNGIDRADTAGCNGKGWREDESYTLNTIDRPAVVYAVDQGGGKSAVNVSEGKAPTLCTTHGGEPAVAYQEEPLTLHGNNYASTLMARDYKGVGRWDTLGAVVSVPTGTTQYIVRRLTPTECARLQGFADWWAYIEPKDTLTEDEFRFWQEVRNTHATINGKTVKEYTKEQMLTWYNKLHSDSSEYKMWGNGIALPTALYVMQGIADELSNSNL